jgi:hypothetical protein
MTFLQIPDANVHIAAIVFFDMLAGANDLQAGDRYQAHTFSLRLRKMF